MATATTLHRAPATVQEMADFVALGFDLAFKYRTSGDYTSRRNRRDR